MLSTYLIDIQGILHGKSVEVYELTGGVYLRLKDGFPLPYHGSGEDHGTVLCSNKISEPQENWSPACAVGFKRLHLRCACGCYQLTCLRMASFPTPLWPAWHCQWPVGSDLDPPNGIGPQLCCDRRAVCGYTDTHKNWNSVLLSLVSPHDLNCTKKWQ